MTLRVGEGESGFVFVCLGEIGVLPLLCEAFLDLNLCVNKFKLNLKHVKCTSD